MGCVPKKVRMAQKLNRKRKGVNPEVVDKAKPKPLVAKTNGQHDYIRAICENDIILATGPAGTGKTAVAVGMAAQAILRGDVEKIIITRPCVEANGKMNNNFGALPGELEEKIAPYLKPAFEELEKFLGREAFLKFRYAKQIEVSPLEFMRGRNFHNAFMILDEAQNCTAEQLKMFITRMGDDTKVCINGDTNQTDLRHGGITDLEVVCDKLDGIEGIAIVELNESDIVRNPMIAKVIRALR
jgi:phosphate starvation-inducible PhoH-like protein